jgi:tRNA threonylcarbamoyladenosine biosynthesis protein TsaE
MMMMTLELQTRSSEETKELGRKLGELAKPGDWIGLTGELGAGKTCLVQGLALGAGVDPCVPVTSPTFVILQTYPGRLPVHHLDLYRVGSLEELFEIGYTDLIHGDGIAVVEWYEQVAECAPDQGLIATLEIIDEDKRSLEISGKGIRGRELLEELKALL